MQPAEIRKNFQLYQTGEISLSEYTRKISPPGREFAPVPQTVSLPFVDNAKNQADRILNLLQDHFAHSTDDISKKIYGADHAGTTRIGARIFDLRKRGYDIDGFPDKDNRALYYYQLKEKWYAK